MSHCLNQLASAILSVSKLQGNLSILLLICPTVWSLYGIFQQPFLSLFHGACTRSRSEGAAWLEGYEYQLEPKSRSKFGGLLPLTAKGEHEGHRLAI